MIPENVKQVMIEKDAAAGVRSRVPKDEAARRARTMIGIASDLFRDALKETGLTVSYHPAGTRIIALASDSDTPPAGSRPLDVVSLREANPGVDIIQHADGSFTADAPSLKFPVPPPRPYTLATLGKDQELVAKGLGISTTTPADPTDEHWAARLRTDERPITSLPEEWSNLRVETQKSFDLNARIQFTPDVAVYGEHDEGCRGECEDAPTEAPPADEPVLRNGRPDYQELEDRLRIIGDIIDGQPSQGTDMANFKRRLNRILG